MTASFLNDGVRQTPTLIYLIEMRGDSVVFIC